MRDFVYYTPTEVVFGRSAENRLPELIKKYGGNKVLIHYGGGSAERSGLLPGIRTALEAAGIAYSELGGVVPNPRLSLVREGISLCRREGVDFILAVGGGSVIDSSKGIAYGLAYDGDIWDFFDGKAAPAAACPVGVVLTIPASGSEMSDSTVLTDDVNGLKRGCNSNYCRPRFAIMNPERTFSLPAYQTACGITDIMMHTMERYFSHDDDMTLTDALAEAVLRTLKDCVYAVLRQPDDYRNRAQIMWGGRVAHNGLTGCGMRDDWATHQLEHELSGMFDVTHGAGLAAIWPSWARYVCHENISRFVKFAVNVMGIPNDFTDPEGTALRGIEAMEMFYRSIGMPVNIHELIGREITDDEIREMVRKCSRDYTATTGSFKVLDAADMEAIYRLAR